MDEARRWVTPGPRAAAPNSDTFLGLCSVESVPPNFHASSKGDQRGQTRLRFYNHEEKVSKSLRGRSHRRKTAVSPAP